MFNDMATYFIFTGQIMGGNGLYMIVVSREALGYRGHAGKPVCPLMRKTTLVHVRDWCHYPCYCFYVEAAF